MTPKNSSTITMARNGRPVESGTRSFIDVTVSRSAGNPTPTPCEQGKFSGEFEAQPPRGPGLLPAGAQPAESLHQHRVGGQRFGAVDQRIQHSVVRGRRHAEQFLDRFFFGTGVFPPLTLEGQDVVFAASQPIGEFRVVPRSISPRHSAVHIASSTLSAKSRMLAAPAIIQPRRPPLTWKPDPRVG